MAEGPIGIDTMTDIQYDSYNSFADSLIPYLLDVNIGNDPFYTEPAALLETWNRGAPAGDGEQGSAAMYYYAVWANVLTLTVDDELPLDLQVSGNSRSMHMVTNLLEDPENPWWDDQRTAGIVESRNTILRQAMIAARLQLTADISKDPNDWQWGRLHTLTARHQVLGEDPAPEIVQSVFNLGPFPMPGGSALINANNWDAEADEFEVTAAPSMRMVVDLDDLDNSVWVNQGGNSGHVFHPNYTDQAQPWIDGETYSWPHSAQAVEDSTKFRLSLVPEE